MQDGSFPGPRGFVDQPAYKPAGSDSLLDASRRYLQPASLPTTASEPAFQATRPVSGGVALSQRFVPPVFAGDLPTVYTVEWRDRAIQGLAIAAKQIMCDELARVQGLSPAMEPSALANFVERFWQGDMDKAAVILQSLPTAAERAHLLSSASLVFDPLMRLAQGAARFVAEANTLSLSFFFHVSENNQIGHKLSIGPSGKLYLAEFDRFKLALGQGTWQWQDSPVRSTDMDWKSYMWKLADMNQRLVSPLHVMSRARYQFAFEYLCFVYRNWVDTRARRSGHFDQARDERELCLSVIRQILAI